MLHRGPTADYNGGPLHPRRKSIPFGKYELLERINIGGMAEILKARDSDQAGAPVIAVKRILPHLTEDQQFVTMFQDESRVLAQLHHDNIIETFEVGQVAHQPFIAIEYVFGQDARMLFHRSRRNEHTVPIPIACYIVAQVCAGLDYAHEQTDDGGALLGLVHRDVSLQNVLLSYDGAVKLTDFGIAMSAENVARTEAGIVKGKFGYMSPEQIRGEPLDRRSDVFATGICLYELLTSERLFSGDSDYAAVERVRNVDIEPPSRFNRQIPSALESIVMKALAKHPRDRYQSAGDMRQALLGFMQGAAYGCTAADLSSYLHDVFSEELKKQPTPDTLLSTVKDSHAEGTGLAAFDNLDPVSTVSSLHDPEPEPAPTPAPMSQAPHRGLAPSGGPSVPPLVPRRESIPPAHGMAPAAATAPTEPDIDWHPQELVPAEDALGAIEPLPDTMEPGDDDVTRQIEVSRTVPGGALSDSGVRDGNPSPFGAPSPVGAQSPAPGGVTPVAGAVTPVGGSIPPATGSQGPDTAPVAVSVAPATRTTMPSAPRAPYGAIVGIVAAIIAVIAGGLFLPRGAQPGVVHLTTKPADVRVTVNGEPVSTTRSPFVLADLEPDVDHQIEVAREGYTSWNTRLMLRSGQTLELPLVTLESAAQEEAVAAAGESAAEEPAASPAKRPSVRKARTKPRAAPKKKKKPSGGTASAKKPRKPKQAASTGGGGFGTLRLNSRPWSQVTVDGRRVGNTPQMNLRLSAGSHTIRLHNPDFGLKKTLKVKIRAGEVTTKIISLQ